MDQVIAHLQTWMKELSTRTHFGSIEEKANHLGVMNSIEVAIKQLELCRTYNINPRSWFCVFPEIPTDSQATFRVVSDEVKGMEVSFPGRGKVTFHAGDLAIKR